MGKLIDETGNIYGRWTVLERDYNKTSKSGDVYWKCRCSCGTEKSIAGHQLRSGRTKSCGCLRKEKFIERVKENALQYDLTGQRFGRLTVIKRTDERNHGSVVYECLCDCGNTIKVMSQSLKDGGTRSCGCLQSETSKKIGIQVGLRYDLTGQKFGKLTVLERIRVEGKGIYYKCLCDCGNTTIIAANHLKNGHTTSCGCINSKGELKISQILRKNNIPFEMQKTFNECRNPKTNKLFKFDFYVDNKYLIEYDGIQHFKYRTDNSALWNDKENFEKTQERDNFKNQYCKDNNIPIIRIPYTKYDTLCLEDLLLETTEFLINKEESEEKIDGETN